MMFILRCPRCRNQMKYATRDVSILNKKKKCVFCNFSMDARKAALKRVDI
jgi:hypothetical protein